MHTTGTDVSQEEIQQFIQASLRAIVRAEAQGRVPLRFTGEGVAVWETFRNALTAADLLALTIQDVGTAMPLPFDPRAWWPGWPDWKLFTQDVDAAEAWIQDALAYTSLPTDAYLRGEAAFLGLSLPADDAVAALPSPEPHEHWLELPGTGGWLAYALCQRPDTRLYLWENFTILCGTPQEMLFAGLVAWALNAPPRTALPIKLDKDLLAALKDAPRYDAVVGRRDRHGRRDLRILHRAGKEPLWI